MKTGRQKAPSGPRMRAGNPCFTVVVTGTLLLGAVDGSQPSAAAGERSRPFRMGFTAPELFMAWQDGGLLDERGHARPACTA
jgi:hypothetical protein